jgi:hypothetical protein
VVASSAIRKLARIKTPRASGENDVARGREADNVGESV